MPTSDNVTFLMLGNAVIGWLFAYSTLVNDQIYKSFPVTNFFT